MNPQLFKGDDVELQYDGSISPETDILSVDKDEFFEGAYDDSTLGDIIFQDSRSPLSQEIPQDVFRVVFSQIFQNFNQAGTFEFYMSVFKAVWGDNVDVTFTVPSPGILQINVEALEIEFDQVIARYIVDNEYFYDNLLTSTGDNLLFQVAQGLKTQGEANSLTQELCVGGILVTITLEIF